MVLTRSQKTSLKTSENDSKSDGDTDHDCSSCSAEKTVSKIKKPKAKRPFSESPTPLTPSESNVSPQPDSTTPPLASTMGEGKLLHASTEAPEKDKDAVAVATDDEVGENEPVKGKRRRKRNRKRKMTTDNENQTDKIETENSTQSKETVEPSISSSTPSVEGLKELNTSVTAEKEAANGKKLKLAENTSVVDDHDDSHSELQKENVNTTAQELGAEQKLEPEGEKSEAKIPTVNAKEVVQLYKKESYTEGQAAKPKGKPKSGRHWKTEQTSRFSGIKQDRPLKTSWQRKMQEKAEMKNMKTFEAELKEAKSIELERKKKQRAKKIKRKLENQRKSEVVQVISNPAKIKRMKKKQLRNIEMRSMPDSSKKQVFK